MSQDPRLLFEDNIVVTLACDNKDKLSQNLRFNTTQSSVIVKNPQMYYLIIEKFRISNKALPIFFFDNSKDDMYIIVNGDKTQIEMGALDYRGSIYSNLSNSSRNGEIYFIGQFLGMLNNALGGTIELSMRDDKRFELTGIVNGDDIIFSKKVYDFFPTLEAIYDSAKQEYQIIREVQEFPAIYAWYDIKSILLVSSDLPVNKQIFHAGDFNEKIKLSIINEFVPLYDSSTLIDKSDWVYESTQLRTIDLRSSESIKSFVFDILLVTKYGKQIPYMLAPGESCSCTFKFIKKALFNNEWNQTNLDDRIKQNTSLSFHRR